jgi:hypothetical protein
LNWFKSKLKLMKKLLLLFLNFYCVAVLGQKPGASITINLPAKPSASVGDWAKSTPPLTVIIQTKGNPAQEKQPKEYRILASIKNGDQTICGKFSPKNALSFEANSTVKTWSGASALGLLGDDCILKPGQYQFCVQVFNIDGRQEAESYKQFTIENTRQINYTAPNLVFPADGKTLTQAEENQEINFRWTPILPKPNSTVKYRVVVFDVLKGQTLSEARKRGEVLFEKEIENQTQMRLGGPRWVPRDPPVNSDQPNFGWYVEARELDGKVLASSETAGFKITTSADVKIVDFTTLCSNEFGKYTFTLKAENPGSNPFNVTGLSLSSPSGSITGVSLSPSLPTTVNTGFTNAVTFSGGFNYSGTYPSIVYATINGTQLGNTNLISSDTELDSLVACVCHDCDKLAINLQGATINPTSNPNLFAATGSINIGGLPAVYGIEMQLLSYSYSATPTACSNGINTVEQSCVFNKTGTIINGLPVSMINETASGLTSTNNGVAKNIKIASSTPLPSSIPINLNIGLPSPIAGLAKDCCKMTHNVCIKVRVFYDKDSCKSCSYTYCFPSFNN